MKQRGQIFLLLLVLIFFAGAGAFYTFFSPTSSRLAGNERTQKIMGEAKDALIGRAASSATRPGQLVCPDMNNDGIAEAPDSAGCPSGNVGRLPWRTLGLDELRDDAGEHLWYAVDPVFTRNATGCCFDNDTRGNLTVSQGQAVNVITTEAVAIIFAPGPLLPGQLRDVANENSPLNYLDTTDGVSNATLSAFIAAPNSDTLPPSPPPSPFNDRLLVISATDLWTIVEMRVARDMLRLLTQYRLATGYYPWAARLFDDDSIGPSDSSSPSPPNGSPPLRHGMVPIEIAKPTNWGSGGTPTPPAWMIGSNEWGKQFYYAIADRAKPGGGSAPLWVDGGDYELVIITPGPAGAVCREYSDPPICSSGYRGINRLLYNYIDAVPGGIPDENRNGNDVFVTTSPSQGYARDRLYFCPGTPGIC